MWGDSSSDKENDNDEVANLCLVAKEEESDSEVSDSEPSYDELLSEYNALHTEFIKVAKEMVSYKKNVKELEINVTSSYEMCKEKDKKILKEDASIIKPS